MPPVPRRPRTPRRGRRAGTPDTRGEILAAARHEFAERGYDGATVRGIAAAAGVDPALVHHYFGSKEQVFVAAMELPWHPGEIVERIMTGPVEGIGERAVRTFLAVWGDPQRRAPFLLMLRGALSSDVGARLLREFVSRALLARVAARLELPDAQLRAELVASHLVGLAVVRYVVRVEPLASLPDEEVVRLVGPVVQRYLTP